MSLVKNVILETSITFGDPISRAVESFISEYKENKKLKIRYWVPDMVVLETENKMWNLYKERFDNFVYKIKEIAKLGFYNNVSTRPIENKFRKTRMESDSYVRSKFSSLGFQILATPTDRIDFTDIIKKAVNRELPFEIGEKEKGFKDMIIAQTVLLSLPSLQKEGDVVFVCPDGKLRDYVSLETLHDKHFKIYPSLVDLKSAIRLSEVLSGDKPIEIISEEAATAFYNEEDKETSLFFKAKIKEEINSRFINIISNPSPREYYSRSLSYIKPISPNIMTNNSESIWVPITPLEHRVSNPVFVKKESELVYIWETTVICNQTFEPRDYLLVGGNLLNSLNFKVVWKTVFGKDGSIDNDKSTLVDIKYIRVEDYGSGWAGISMSPSRLSGASLSSYQGNLTNDGQGTVPVGAIAYPIPSPSPDSSDEDPD